MVLLGVYKFMSSNQKCATKGWVLLLKYVSPYLSCRTVEPATLNKQLQ